jgi:hypothetical protein
MNNGKVCINCNIHLVIKLAGWNYSRHDEKNADGRYILNFRAEMSCFHH